MSVIYRVASNLPPGAKRVILDVHRRWWTAVRRVVTITSPGRRWLFGQYAATNYWGDDDSRSGRGSNLGETAAIRRELPGILARHDISSVLDVPCGDGFWIAHLQYRLERYVGADIVPALIDQLQASATPGREYLCLDAVRDELAQVDAILSRDFMGHLSQKHVTAVLANFRRSGARFLIATTFAGYTNSDIETGNWRPVNLEAPRTTWVRLSIWSMKEAPRLAMRPSTSPSAYRASTAHLPEDQTAADSATKRQHGGL